MSTPISPGVYQKDDVNLYKVLEQLQPSISIGDAGAFMTFIGVVKTSGEDGKSVKELVIESHEDHANVSIQRICDELKVKHGVLFVGIYHLTGTFRVGEPLVLVAVASRSRSEAFPALQEAVARYKTEPALWKKEIYCDESGSWISH